MMQRGGIRVMGRMACSCHMKPMPRRRFCAVGAGDNVGSMKVLINYQEPTQGLRAGRYIVPPTHFQYDVVDAHKPRKTTVHNARLLDPPPSLASFGFTLQSWPTKCLSFSDDVEVIRSYYAEMRDLIKKITGANQVLVFDHATRRAPCAGEATQGLEDAVEGDGGAFSSVALGAVERAHCDYTALSGRELVEAIGERGVHSRVRGRLLTAAEFGALASQRYAVVNVWRNIDQAPLQRMPLAVCDARTVAASDRVHYEVIYPIYAGGAAENYSLRYNEQQQWYYYPNMLHDECLLFKTFDTAEQDPRFVFHTALPDAPVDADVPPRRSIEVRAVAFFAGAAGEDDLQCKVKIRQGKLVGRFASHE